MAATTEPTGWVARVASTLHFTPSLHPDTSPPPSPPSPMSPRHPEQRRRTPGHLPLSRPTQHRLSAVTGRRAAYRRAGLPWAAAGITGRPRGGADRAAGWRKETPPRPAC
ncbi:hypothetical protein E2C01_069395 [Portunus trituberculatus]|uniref:Uncharacterized protein n=1 Tax=Portunus trituberculatus TaxID=210409 RepID=A0A5B7HUF0_PORTR|nr:hypothetical protein [Portunus trituberculatus]